MTLSESSPVRVVALVMAAGCSRRFGTADKRRARLGDGRALLTHAVERATAAFDDCHVVLREDDEPDALGLLPGTGLIRAPHADQGLGSSLADAIGVLDGIPGADALAVLLGDMPHISAATLTSLARAASRDTILCPVHQGRRGHPVLFGRALWPELAALRGDRGARDVVRRHASRLRLIHVEDPGIHRDVDTPADIADSPEPVSPAGRHSGVG